MTRLPLVAMVMLVIVSDARAQDCEPLSGPTRTDCFIGRARLLGQQSDIAAGTVRRRADEGYLRAVTGTSSAPTQHRAKPKHKAAPR